MGAMRARVLLAVTALLALGWLAVSLRDDMVQTRALASVSFAQDVPAARLTRAADRLRSAELLNPDQTLRLYRANFYARQGQTSRGVRLVEDVVRREPENLDAWGLLFRLTNGTNPRLAARATAQLRRLNPRGGPPTG